MLLLSPVRWWVLLAQSALSLSYGILLLVFPAHAAWFAAPLWGALSVANGLLGGFAALRERHRLEHWWIDAVIGGVNLGLGGFVLACSLVDGGAGLGLLATFVGIQALFQGSMAFGVSLEMVAKLRVKRMFVFYGVVALGCGIVVLAAPYAGRPDVLPIVAAAAIAAGLGQILDSLHLKRLVH